MSNFTFLTTTWPDLYATAREAEQNVTSTLLSHRASVSTGPLSPRTSCFYTRRSLEIAVKWLSANDSYLKKPYANNLAASLSPIFHLQLSTTNKMLTV